MCLQGPVLSAHKKLLAEKLAEEEEERKVKGEAKKEKHLVLNFWRNYLMLFHFFAFRLLFLSYLFGYF